MNLTNKFLTVIVLTLGLTQSALALEIGEEAPCVVLDQVKNGVDDNHCIRDPQFENKPVLVEFFSITCGACIANIPNLKNLVKDLDGKATVRMVSIDKNKAKVLDFIKEHALEGIEVAFDVDKAARKAYKIQYTPTMFMLDQKNIVADIHIGTLEEDSYSELVKKVEELGK